MTALRHAATALPLVHPHRGDLLDVILLVVLAAAALSGLRRGLVVGALSATGLVAGGALGARLGPRLVRSFVAPPTDAPSPELLGQRLLALLVVVVAALVVQAVAISIGVRIQHRLRTTPVRWLDPVGGAALAVLATLVLAWLTAIPVARGPFPQAVQQVRRSAILDEVAQHMPPQMNQLVAELERLWQHEAWPPMVGAFGAVPLPPAGATPPPRGVDHADRVASADVVKVWGEAPSCRKDYEGSAFVISAQHVLTNAHVVAGVEHPVVIAPGGSRPLAARVVLFDPDRDMAVLYVPGLHRAPLHFAATVATGARGAVVGYPEDGPLTLGPARVEGEQWVAGPNIYESRQVTRQVYTLDAHVRPGNSGGPLLNRDGAVAGVVFAASTDERDVAYALTSSEVMPDVHAGATATSATSTQGCD